MKKFIVKYFGSATTRPLEHEDHSMSTDFVVRYVEGSLAHYWPVYTSAAVWEVSDKDETTLVAAAACVGAEIVTVREQNLQDRETGRPVTYQPHQFLEVAANHGLGHNDVLNFLLNS